MTPTPVLFEPESAIAASLCMAARLVARHGITERHPRRCGWCDYPIDALRQMVEGFNEWAGYNERDGTYGQHDARAFQGLPHREQLHRIVAAQSFEPEPPPVAPIEPAEDLSWLG